MQLCKNKSSKRSAQIHFIHANRIPNLMDLFAFIFHLQIDLFEKWINLQGPANLLCIWGGIATYRSDEQVVYSIVRILMALATRMCVEHLLCICLLRSTFVYSRFRPPIYANKFAVMHSHGPLGAFRIIFFGIGVVLVFLHKMPWKFGWIYQAYLHTFHVTPKPNKRNSCICA